MSFVELARDGDVVVVTLNRPERLNAVHLAMRDELWGVLQLLRDDPTARAAVFHGAGDRAFSAGADITEFGTAPSVVDARDARLNRDLWGLTSRLEIPLVAAIQGFAYGAGLELSLHCDLRIADPTARFALPEVTLGYAPSAGGTQTLARHLPRSEALRLVTSGDPIDARRAYELGLLYRIVEPAALLPEAVAVASRLAAFDAAAVRAVKRAVVSGLDLPLAEGIALERRLGQRVAAGA
jgi:enoyl-CoA hydratase/carnithine racemase